MIVILTLMGQQLGLRHTTQSNMPANRKMLAVVENFGIASGDYAQLEQSTFEDLVRRGKISGDVTWEKVQSDPAFYDYAVDAFWDDLTTTFSIPEDDYTKALWTLMPGRYKKTGGDIEKISTGDVEKDERLKGIMRSRERWLNEYLQNKE